ncbi:MAG: GNAT family N-acetyltransferase [Deltaproteobacteria bacterium]|nr:GNAT family N-acetyltransferase [Deltaproteobacteria bacterium]
MSRRTEPGTIVTLRRAEPGESTYLAHTSYRAFHSSTVEGWEGWFREHTGVQRGDTVVAEVEGRRAGNATALALTMALAGRDIPMWGVAGVSVPPEFRQRGVADAMMRELLSWMRSRGEALSMLYAFKLGYYRRFGYGLCERVEQLRVHPSQLPGSRLRTHVTEMVPGRDMDTLRSLYERSREAMTGPLARDDYWWETRALGSAPAGAVYRDPGTGEAQGYALWRVPAQPEFPRQEMHVRELVALSPEAHEGLLGFLAAQGEQYAMVTLWTAPGQSLPWLVEHGVVDAPAPWLRYDPMGAVYAGAMARVVDVAAALRLHPSASRTGQRATFGLDVTDPTLDDVLHLDVNLTPDAVEVGPGALAAERLSLGIEGLSQVYLAATTTAALRASGRLHGSAKAGALLERACEGSPLFVGALNAF